MRIRNEGKRVYCFNGGSIAPKEVVDIKDEAVARALLKCYPNELVSLDDLVARVVETPARVVEVKEPEEKKEEEVEVVKAPKGKRKKASK